MDASGETATAGVLGPDGVWLAWTEGMAGALEGLFPAVRTVLADSKLEIGGLAGLVNCQGPGSVLGVRLAAMAAEAWRRLPERSLPVFRYDSLRLTAALLAADGVSEALVFSEWKQDAWKALALEGGVAGASFVLNDAELAAHPLTPHHLPRRKGWHDAPGRARRLRYEPRRLPEVIGTTGLLEPCGAEVLPAAEVPEYRKWTPKRHR